MREKSQKAARLFLTKDILEILWNISFLLLMLAVICFGHIQWGTNYYYYFTFFFFVGVTMAETLLRRNWYRQMYLPLQTVWYGLFILLAIISAFWAPSFGMLTLPMKRMIQNLVLTYCLAQHVSSKDRLEEYIRIVLAVSLFLAIYLLVRTPFDQWFSGFLGRGTGYNSNDIGQSLAVCVIFAFYEAYIRHKKFCYAIAAISMFTVFLTSSRKAISMSILGVILLVAFNFRTRKYMLRVLCILALAALLILLVFQVPQLYRVIGIRLETMVEYFMSDKDVDYSISLRHFYIGVAKSILREHPLIGIGMNNFSDYITRYGDTLAYCHNNYWEIAADLGIVGLIVYYWFYVYLFFKLVRQVFDGHKTALVFLTLLVQFLVFEYGIVNYYKTQSHLILAAAFCAVAINDDEESEPERLPAAEEKP